MGRHDVLTIDIDGMTCAGCVGRAERALSAVQGVEKAEVNLATHAGRVVLAPDAGAEVTRRLSGALVAAGYPAVPVRVRLAVTGMTCASCVSHVERALQAVPGVLSAQVSLADQTARVTALSGDVVPLIAAVEAVISSTRTIPVTGARTLAPKNAAIPTTAIGTAREPMSPGHARLTTPTNNTPHSAPIASMGANRPPTTGAA